jgi:hypothetical protein
MYPISSNRACVSPARPLTPAPLNTAIRTPTTVGLGSGRVPPAVSPVGPVASVPVPPIVGPPVNGTVAPPPSSPPSPEDDVEKA